MGYERKVLKGEGCLGCWAFVVVVGGGGGGGGDCI